MGWLALIAVCLLFAYLGGVGENIVHAAFTPDENGNRTLAQKIGGVLLIIGFFAIVAWMFAEDRDLIERFFRDLFR